MKKRIFTAVTIMLVLLLIIGCGNKKELVQVSVQQTEDLVDDSGQKVGEVDISIDAEVEVISDCGGIECFEEKFTECKPATVTLTLMENMIYYYEIIGPKDGLCEVKSKYIANPNPEWVGEEMTCKYDNTQEFMTAVKDMSNCQGPLHVLMTDWLES